jgi:hypothetical protein
VNKTVFWSLSDPISSLACYNLRNSSGGLRTDPVKEFLTKGKGVRLDTLFNPLKMKRNLFHLKTQFVPRSKHFSSRLKKRNQFTLYKAKVAVCCNINTIDINTVWAECRIFVS